MRTIIQLIPFFAAILMIAPASAQLYKWVDERGVTNYSNEPPTDPKSLKKVARVEDRLSVYTPDEGTLKAAQAMRDRAVQAISARVPEPQAVRYQTAAPQSPYEQCVASGRLGCETFYSDYYPAYLPAVAAFRGRPVQPTRFLSPPGNRISTASPARMSRSVPLR